MECDLEHKPEAGAGERQSRDSKGVGETGEHH
jgi:hypothetical protein